MRITDPSQLQQDMEIFYVCDFSNNTRHKCIIKKYKVVHCSVPPNSDPNGDPRWIDIELMTIRDDVSSIYLAPLTGIPIGVWEDSDSLLYYVGRVRQHSMQDMGIIPNHYNKHQAFTTLDDAKLYGQGKLLDLFDVAPDLSVTNVVSDYDRAMGVIR